MVPFQRMSLRVLFLLSVAFSVSYGRCRFRESRVNEQVIRVQRNCRGKVWQIGEEYWSSVGYDGLLRNGRTTNDFLALPQSGDGQVRDGWVAYWITRTRYGPGNHYEVFGHAFLRHDGRVCAWFAGRDRDAIELCDGFRVLSRNRNNPNEEMPFEWIQAGYARPREAIGFHHHRIAKYEWTPEDVFYGDATLRESTFRGVSPTARFFIEMSTPDVFARKVWVLRRKPEVAAALEARAQYYPERTRPRYESRTYPGHYAQSFPRGDETSGGAYSSQVQGAAPPRSAAAAVGAGVRSEWPAGSPAQEGPAPGGIGGGVRSEHGSPAVGSGARPEWPAPSLHATAQDGASSRTAGIGEGVRSDSDALGGGVRPEWSSGTSHGGNEVGRGVRPEWPSGTSHGRSEVGRGVRPEWPSSGSHGSSDAVGGGARPEWSPVHASNHQGGHHANVPQVHLGSNADRASAERAPVDLRTSQEADGRRTHASRPEWTASEEARRRMEGEESGRTGTPASHSRDHVRFRYMKPQAIATDQYGRLYEERTGNGPARERPQDRSDGWGTVDPNSVQEHLQHHRNHAQQHIRDRSQQVDEYEAQRRAYHQDYLRQLEQRKLESERRRAEHMAIRRQQEERYHAEQVARRREEEERQRAEQAARRREEEERRAEQMADRREEEEKQRAEYATAEVPTAFQPPQSNEHSDSEDNYVSRTDVKDIGEISQYPERLPVPRPLLKEEMENDES